MRAKVLCVDDDLNILEALKRQHWRAFDIHIAQSGAIGLELLANQGPFPVVVSDMRMPHMNGSQFLATVRARFPDTSRILLTGYSEMESAIDAVNVGHIFRFLCKPCTPEALSIALVAGVEQHRLRKAEQELLESTLRGSINALSEVLSLASPLSFGRALRIQRIAVELAKTSGLSNIWQLEVAAILSQLGAVTLPAEVVERWSRGEPLSSAEQAMVNRFPEIAESLLERIPRLERVREIIRLYPRAYAPSSAEAGGLEARILRVAVDLDALQLQGLTTPAALLVLADRGVYDPAVLACAREHLNTSQQSSGARVVALRMLKTGMVLDQDLRDEQQGMLLVARGHMVGESLLIRLLNLGARPGLPEFVRVVG